LQISLLGRKFKHKYFIMCFWPSSLKDWFEIVKDLATIIGLAIGGVWAWWQFKFFGDKYSKMELSLEIVDLGCSDCYHMIEIQGEATNKGKRGQTLYGLNVQIWGYIHGGTSMSDVGKNVKLPIPLDKHVFFVNPINPNENDYLIVDGGTTQKFTYLAAIDFSIDWVSVAIVYFLKPNGGCVDLRKTCRIRRNDVASPALPRASVPRVYNSASFRRFHF
jgi:hypothetical protein